MQFTTIATGLGTSNKKEIDEDGNLEEEPISNHMLNELYTGYNIGTDVNLGVVGNWAIRPSIDEKYEILDPYLMLSHGEVYSIGDFSIGADLRLSAPVSEESKEHGLITALASAQQFQWQFSRSRFSLELETFAQYNFFRKDGDASDLEFHYEPAVLYQLTGKLQLLMAYESEMSNRRHEDLMQVDNEAATIKSGVSWEISRNANLQPFIDFNLKEKSGSLIGAEFNWVIL